MTVKSIQGLSWRWQMFAGRLILATDGGGAMVILAGAQHAPILTRDPVTGVLRAIAETDEVARIIESAPDIRRHAQALVDGIDLGLVRIDTDADESLSNVLARLRLALAKAR